MPSGDPPVTGNPADQSGTITFEAEPNADTDNIQRNKLTVRLKKNKRLQITIRGGEDKDKDPVIVTARADKWSLLLEEID